MRNHAAGALLLSLLLAPCASAWTFSAQHPLTAEVTVRDGLLLAGVIQTAGSVAFGAIDIVSFDPGAAVDVARCPDSGGSPAASTSPSCENVSVTAWNFSQGGLLLFGADDPAVDLRLAAGVALLTGAAVVEGVSLEHGLYTGGRTTLSTKATAIAGRLLGDATFVEVESSAGPRRWEGTNFTLYLSGAQGIRIDAQGAIMAIEVGQSIALAPSGIPASEIGIRPLALLPTLQAALPPSAVDGVADVDRMFGPFAQVWPLLDGVIAARRNLTIAGAPGDGFQLIRVRVATIVATQEGWEISGDARYFSTQDRVAKTPGATPGIPTIALILLVALAFASRALTKRDAPPWQRAMIALTIRIGGLIAVWFVLSLHARWLLGVDPFADWSDLSARSRVQLFSLSVVGALLVFVALTLVVESYLRSAMALRGRTRARVIPAAVATLVALFYVAIGGASVLSFATRLVRL